MGLRLLIGFVAAIVIWVGAIAYTHIPKDRYLPPSMSMDDLNLTTTGYVVDGHESGYSDHWMDGNMGMEWYLDYKFQPTLWNNLPTGGHESLPQTAYQTGRVQIDEGTYNKIKPGASIEISYDPFNPLLNGVTGTGKINVSATWFSGWLLYVLGFLATAIAVAEIMKKWIVPSGI